MDETVVPRMPSANPERDMPVSDESVGTSTENRLGGEIKVSSVIVPSGRRAIRDEVVTRLAQSIQDIGLQNPIVVTDDGRLVSGAHRLEAFRRLGRETIPCRIAPMDGALCQTSTCERHAALVTELQEIDENLQRADLTALEQGEAIARRKVIYETLHPETKQHVIGGKVRQSASDKMSFAADTSKKAGIAERTVQRAAQIGSMPEGVRDAVRETPIANNQSELLKLAREAKRDPERAQRIAEAARETQAKRVTDARQTVREHDTAAKAEAVPTDIASIAELHASEVRGLRSHVQPATVDLILTDPPYPKDFLGVFSDLAAFAAHALKPGGQLAVMIGQSYLPQIAGMFSEWDSLEYRWTIAYLTPGGQAPQIWDRGVNTFWKPVLVYRRAGGDTKPEWMGDVARSEPNDNDKRYHFWGQSESGMASLLDRLSDPGDVVCDPFLGGGTTGVVAVVGKRRFIGADMDQKCLQTFRARIAEVSHESA